MLKWQLRSIEYTPLPTLPTLAVSSTAQMRHGIGVLLEIAHLSIMVIILPKRDSIAITFKVAIVPCAKQPVKFNLNVCYCSLLNIWSRASH